jgi:hypothetical protein
LNSKDNLKNDDLLFILNPVPKQNNFSASDASKSKLIKNEKISNFWEKSNADLFNGSEFNYNSSEKQPNKNFIENSSIKKISNSTSNRS